MLIRRPSLRRRLLGIATLLVVAAGLIVAALRPDPFTDRQTVWAKFDNVNGLGSIDRDIRVAGVNEGEIGAVERVGDDALVELEVNSEIPVHSDAQVALRPHTLFEGSAFVDLHPGSPSAPLIDEGTTIPLRQTRVYVSFDEALRVLREPARERLRELVRIGAEATADGSIESLQRTLRAAPELTRDLGPTARALQGSSRTELQRSIGAAAGTVERARPARGLAGGARRARQPDAGGARRRRGGAARPGPGGAAGAAGDASRPRARARCADRPHRRARGRAPPGPARARPGARRAAASARGVRPRRAAGGAARARDRHRPATRGRRGPGLRASADDPAPGSAHPRPERAPCAAPQVAARDADLHAADLGLRRWQRGAAPLPDRGAGAARSRPHDQARRLPRSRGVERRRGPAALRLDRASSSRAWSRACGPWGSARDPPAARVRKPAAQGRPGAAGQADDRAADRRGARLPRLHADEEVDPPAGFERAL